jgi:hypothetical protein
MKFSFKYLSLSIAVLLAGCDVAGENKRVEDSLGAQQDQNSYGQKSGELIATDEGLSLMLAMPSDSAETGPSSGDVGIASSGNVDVAPSPPKPSPSANIRIGCAVLKATAQSVRAGAEFRLTLITYTEKGATEQQARAYGCGQAIRAMIVGIPKDQKHQLVGEYLLNGKIQYAGKSDSFLVQDQRVKLALKKSLPPPPPTGDVQVDISFEGEAQQTCGNSSACPDVFAPAYCQATVAPNIECKEGQPCPAVAALLLEAKGSNECFALNDLTAQACRMGYSRADVARTVRCEPLPVEKPKASENDSATKEVEAP